MMTIPADALADLHDRFGHVLSEYDGLAEALYEHEQLKTTKADPEPERPRFPFGYRTSLSPRRVVEPVRLGVVLGQPANHP